jgi:hypothetical protein
MAAVCLKPTDHCQHIDLTKEIVFEPENNLVLLFVITEGTVFFQGFFDEPGLAYIVVLVEKIKTRLPESLTTHVGFRPAFAEHLPPGDNLSFVIKISQALGKVIPVRNMQLGTHADSVVWLVIYKFSI